MLEANSCRMMMLLRSCLHDVGCRDATHLSRKHRKGVYTASHHAAASLLGLFPPEVKCLSQHIEWDMLKHASVSLYMHNEQQTLKRTADKSPVLTAKKSSLSKHDPDSGMAIKHAMTDGLLTSSENCQYDCTTNKFNLL